MGTGRENRGGAPVRSSPASARSPCDGDGGARVSLVPRAATVPTRCRVSAAAERRVATQACRLAADMSFDRAGEISGVRGVGPASETAGAPASGRRPASPAGKAGRRPPPKASARPREAGSSRSTRARSTPARRAGAARRSPSPRSDRRRVRRPPRSGSRATRPRPRRGYVGRHRGGEAVPPVMVGPAEAARPAGDGPTCTSWATGVVDPEGRRSGPDRVPPDAGHLPPGEHIAAAGKRLFGEGTAAATAFHEHGRDLLLKEGWAGVCRLIGEGLTREDTPPRRAALDRMLGYFVSHLAGWTTAGDGPRRRDRQLRGGGRGQDTGPTAEARGRDGGR